jgi:hypothetical protein
VHQPHHVDGQRHPLPPLLLLGVAAGRLEVVLLLPYGVAAARGVVVGVEVWAMAGTMPVDF